MKRNIEFIVYLLGVMVFGFFYQPIKSALGGGIWFLLGGVVIILALRGIAILARHIVERRH